MAATGKVTIGRYERIRCDNCGVEYNPIKDNERRTVCPGSGCKEKVPAPPSATKTTKTKATAKVEDAS